MTIQFTKKHAIISIIVILLIAAAAPSIYFFREYQKSQALLKNPAEATKADNQRIVAEVAKIADVPGEEPTIANVSDKDKLKAQPFFARAENGDRVLFYPSTKKAILYRPSTGKIIEMSPVNVGGSSPSAEVAGATAPPIPVQASPTPVKTLRVAIYNGTTTPKLANNVEKILLEKMDGSVLVVKKDNAVKSDYDKTLVIDISGGQADGAKRIAELVNGNVSTLPSGETKPEAEILIIIGKNYTPK